MQIFNVLVEIINKLGYFGIFVATALEYGCFPVSSEFLLPFIGYTVSQGEMNIVIVILFSTMGGIIGCLFCYIIGRFCGGFINRTICKKWKTAKLGIENAEKFFEKYGKQSVLIGRVFPIVRTYISIPAGMSRMNFFDYTLYSAIGALVWNTILISLGYFLGEHWGEAKLILSSNSSLIYFVLGIISFLLFIKIRRSKKTN